MDWIDIKYFNYCKRSCMMAAKSKKVSSNMNTTTNAKHTMTSSGFRSLIRHGAIKTAKQVERKSDTPSCLSRWPSEIKHKQSITNTTTATLNNYKYSNSNMKTLNTRKFAFVTIGFLAVVLLGTVLVNEKGLAVVGEYIGYLAALAILSLAAMDNPRTKKLV